MMYMTYMSARYDSGVTMDEAPEHDDETHMSARPDSKAAMGAEQETCRQARQSLSGEFRKYRKVFTALGDETRQQIFLVLLDSETVGMRVLEVTAQTHLSRPAVSHHLQILKDAGLVGVHREGTRNYYYVDANSDIWSGLKGFIEHVDVVVGSAIQCDYPKIEKGR